MCSGSAADSVLRADEVNSLVPQLVDGSCVSPAANSNMKNAATKTLQPRHNRPTNFVHRTRVAGASYNDFQTL